MLRLAIMGDLHYARTERIEGLSGLRAVQERFLDTYFRHFFGEPADGYISVGDLTHTGSLQEYEDVYRKMGDSRPRFMQVLGNHDVLDNSKDKVLAFLKQPAYHSITTKEATLLFLDTTRERSPDHSDGRMDDEQLRWLESIVEQNESQPLILFAHHPIRGTTAFSERDQLFVNSERLEEILQRRKGTALYLNGHNHVHSVYRQGNWRYIQTAACLAAPSYRIVTISGNRISVKTRVLSDGELKQYGLQLEKELLYFPDAVRPVPSREDLELEIDLSAEGIGGSA